MEIERARTREKGGQPMRLDQFIRMLQEYTYNNYKIFVKIGGALLPTSFAHISDNRIVIELVEDDGQSLSPEQSFINFLEKNVTKQKN